MAQAEILIVTFIPTARWTHWTLSQTLLMFTYLTQDHPMQAMTLIGFHRKLREDGKLAIRMPKPAFAMLQHAITQFQPTMEPYKFEEFFTVNAEPEKPGDDWYYSYNDFDIKAPGTRKK